MMGTKNRYHWDIFIDEFDATVNVICTMMWKNLGAVPKARQIVNDIPGTYTLSLVPG